MSPSLSPSLSSSPSTTFAIARRAGAIALLVVGAVALSGCSILDSLTGGGQATRDETGQVVEGNDATDVFTLQVGDCLNDVSLDEEVTSVPTVPCSEPHDSEIFASIILTGDEFPGQTEVQNQANDACLPEFDSFVGLPYADSMLDYSFYFPTESSWAGGDREVLCVIYDPTAQVTGSLEGAQE